MRKERLRISSTLWVLLDCIYNRKLRSLSIVILGCILLLMLWGVVVKNSVRAVERGFGVRRTSSVTLSEVSDSSFLAVEGPITPTLFLPVLRSNFPPPLFFEDLFGFDKGWTPFKEDGVISGTVGGEYTLGHEKALHIGRSIAPPCSESDPNCEDPLPTSYWITVDARFATNDQDVNQYGILFDYVSNSEYYLFLVEPNPNQPVYRVFRSNPEGPGDFHLQLASGGSSAIRTGAASNDLMVKREGNRIRVYANNALLADINDSTYTGGRLGLDVWVITAPGEARFDNFRVFELP